jgi:hypothetical protein
MDTQIPQKCSIRNPVFIFGSHKSGTSLLRSLLDSHPDLHVLPRETHFFRNAGYWIDYGLMRRYPVQLSKEEILRNTISSIEGQNSSKDRFSDNPHFKGFDLEKFRVILPENLPDDHGELFGVIMGALYASYYGGDVPEECRIVEKSVEHAEYAGIIRKHFPDAKFIHVLRNPYATVVAIRRSREKRKYPKMKRIAASLYNSYYNLFKNLEEQNDYLIVKYEDLVRDTEEEMRKITQYLGIEWDDILLHPTDGGKLWKGNSSSGFSFRGISESPLIAWKDHINHFEIYLVNVIAEPFIKRFGYQKVEPRRNILIPVKRENVVTWIHNRTFMSGMKP